MKKILLIILFLTGITPVFKNNSLNLGCSQAYAQDMNGSIEEIAVCSKNETSTSQQLGDWLVTTTCHLVLEDNECVSVCSDNNVYSPADGGQGDPDPNGGGSSGGGGSGGSGGGSGGQQNTPKYGVPPITKEEFEKLKSIDWKNHKYNIQVKENAIVKIKVNGSEVLVRGQLTKIESDGVPKEKFYKFTPYNSEGTLQKDLYYHYNANYVAANVTYYSLETDTTGFPTSGWANLGGMFDIWGQPLRIEIEPDNSPIEVINNVPLTMKNWYCDVDSDRYHSRIMQASSRPGQAWIEGTSRGMDCNDNDPRATTDCRPEWILDKDGDGYHQSTVRSNTSPGQYWVKGRPIETDCNDNAYNATNNCTMLKWYTDEDKDGWANILESVAQPGPNWTNWPMQSPDCDDLTPSPTNVCNAATLLIGPEYNNSFPVNFGIVSLDVKSKTENNSLVIAAIVKHINDMLLSDLTKIVNHYNININTSGKVDAYAIKKEVADFISGNGVMSQGTQEFHDWLANSIALQTSALTDALKIEYFDALDSTFGEDDDFAKVGQSDPFFVNNTDDPWRLKQYLSPDDSYFIGLVAGLGDGVIETADFAYNLTKFSINNSPSVLLFHLLTDTKATVQDGLNKIQIAKDVVSVLFDKQKQEQIYNTIKTAIGNWFDASTFQKTNVQAGYEHGKILFEILGALVGIEEVKALLKTGQFSATALSAIAKTKDLFTFGNKLNKIDGVSCLIDDAGRVIAKGDEAVVTFLKVKNLPKGSRPDPSTYLDADYIANHLAKFDDGVVRISTRDNFNLHGTLGGNEAYVMPEKDFYKIWTETGGDIRKVETRLGLNPGDLGNNPAIGSFKRSDLGEIKIPSGNEAGANNNWIPGGETSGRILEATVDLSNPNIPYITIN